MMMTSRKWVPGSGSCDGKPLSAKPVFAAQGNCRELMIVDGGCYSGCMCTNQSDTRAPCHGKRRTSGRITYFMRLATGNTQRESLTGITAKKRERKRERESLFIHSKQFIITIKREYIEEGCQKGWKAITVGRPLLSTIVQYYVILV